MALDRLQCPRCHQWYMRTLPATKVQDPDRGICTTPLCVAIETWDAERWEGAARMAEVRKASSVALSAVDIEALHRARVT